MEFLLVIAGTAVVVVIALVRALRTPRHTSTKAKPTSPVNEVDPILELETVNSVLTTAVVETTSAVWDPPVAHATEVPVLPEPTVQVRKPRRNYLEYENVAYFPDPPTKTVRCVGMGNYLSDRKRERLNPGFVLAIPEPKNKHDANAIAIADPAGRKLGYLSAGQAKSYAPLIQALGALQINCRRDRMKLCLDLPTLPALRKVAARPDG